MWKLDPIPKIRRLKTQLRYHGRCIVSVWKSRWAHWMKTPTITFPESLLVIEYKHTLEILWKVIFAVTDKKKLTRNTASNKRDRFRAWIIGEARLTSEMVSVTHYPENGCLRFSRCGLVFFSLHQSWYFQCRRFLLLSGHNFGNERKIKQSPTSIFEDFILNIPAHFQPIPSEDARKRTKNVIPYVQFHFIEKTETKTFWDRY